MERVLQQLAFASEIVNRVCLGIDAGTMTWPQARLQLLAAYDALVELQAHVTRVLPTAPIHRSPAPSPSPETLSSVLASNPPAASSTAGDAGHVGGSLIPGV